MSIDSLKVATISHNGIDYHEWVCKGLLSPESVPDPPPHRYLNSSTTSPTSIILPESPPLNNSAISKQDPPTTVWHSAFLPAYLPPWNSEPCHCAGPATCICASQQLHWPDYPVSRTFNTIPWTSIAVHYLCGRVALSFTIFQCKCANARLHWATNQIRGNALTHQPISN